MATDIFRITPESKKTFIDLTHAGHVLAVKVIHDTMLKKNSYTHTLVHNTHTNTQTSNSSRKSVQEFLSRNDGIMNHGHGDIVHLVVENFYVIGEQLSSSVIWSEGKIVTYTCIQAATQLCKLAA